MEVRLYFVLVTVFIPPLVSMDRASKCNPTSWGDPIGTDFLLKPETLTPGIRNWSLKITVPEDCDIVSGANATACDYDQAPHLKFDDKFVLYIHRMGKLQEAGNVTVVLHCTPLKGSDLYTALLFK